MTDRNLDLIFYALLLILPLSALFAARPPLGRVVRAALTSGLIFAVGALAVKYRHRLPELERFLDDQQVVGHETRIRMSPDGHFWANVAINGVPRRMLIDSGATTTALSEGTAAAAGIDVGDSPIPVLISTANGTVTAKTGAADRVAVGSVSTRKLGVVVSPAFGDTDVIGMNFLSRLKSWRVEGRTLVLTPKGTSGRADAPPQDADQA